MSQRTIEQHLAILLKDFDPNIYSNYLSRVEKLRSEVESLNFEDKTEIIRTPDMSGTTALRLYFDIPVHIMLSHPICRFRSQKLYGIRENTFIANLGLVPVYFATMNTMTVMKLWGERTRRFFSPVNEPIPDDKITCWELSNEAHQLEYSTMNFILEHNSDEKLVSKTLLDIFEKYMKFAYWSFPQKGFTFSSQVFYSRDFIKSVMKVAKSLYIIEKVGQAGTYNYEGQSLRYRRALLRGLSRKGDKYFFVKFDALIEEETAKSIESNRDKRTLVNGTVTEIKQNGQKHELLTVIQEFENSYQDILKCLIGIVATARNNNSKNIFYIGKYDDLKDDVIHMYRHIQRDIGIPYHASGEMYRLFDSALNDMFPIVVMDKDDVFYCHPMIISFIDSLPEGIDMIFKDPKILTAILKLADKIQTIKSVDIFITNEAEYLNSKGYSKLSIVQGINKISKMVKIAKLMSISFYAENVEQRALQARISICPHCNFKARYKFVRCPECGSEQN